MTDVVIKVHRKYISVEFEAPIRGDRLTYQADGLNIYIRRMAKGLRMASRWAAIDNQALQVCTGLHIPAMTLKRVDGSSGSKSQDKTHSEAHRRTRRLL